MLVWFINLADKFFPLLQTVALIVMYTNPRRETIPVSMEWKCVNISRYYYWGGYEVFIKIY